ncbi:MAG: cobyrinate a,c-diamide synthase [Cocleimonas sp.]
MSRIYISAAHKSSGKTTLSIGLCAALHQQGLIVQPFKKGPDYIDPIWLAQASAERACFNIDFNTMSNAEIKSTLQKFGADADISIIEGNKGLYDGVALDGSDSNAAMAKLIQSPVVLVIDAQGITRGVAPLLLGYQQFDRDVNIVGVIYNFTNGGRHDSKLRAVTEEYTDIPVLGMVQKNPLLGIAERHLGLMPSNEDSQALQKIAEIGNIISNSVDTTALINISKQAQEICTEKLVTTTIRSECNKIRLGICEDAAFGFYYADDKLALERAGAELISIDTLNDEELPDNLDGLFIGGGFPEVKMQQLANNLPMRNSIYNAIEAGLPTYAECGGLMYLSKSIDWNGETESMVGIIPGDVEMHNKPQGRGYVQLEETENMLWESADIEGKRHPMVINAHEFHYSCLKNLSSKGKFAYKVHRGVGINGKYDGWVYKNLLANYSHMRDTENYRWAERFVNFIRENKEKRTN